MTEISGISVLHVDDDPAFVDLTADMLAEQAGEFIVETATSASEGLDLLATTDFDCIVSDYQMPAISGLDFLSAIREEDATTPFIVFTAKGSEEIASKAIATGVSDYVQKTPETDQYRTLVDRIRRAVDAAGEA